MIQSRRSSGQSGFTLVELNLAIVFVALLVLAIATTIVNVTHTYTYGVSLKTINQLGREVSGQMRRDIVAASPDRTEYVMHEGIGRLCLGSVSYVFNSAELLNTDAPDPDFVVDSNTLEPITLARINDGTNKWCDTSEYELDNATDTYTELLLNDNTPLAIHEMQLDSLIASEEGAQYKEGITRVVFNLGTNEADTTDAGKCKPPTDPDQNFDNCAVRQFVVVARTIGG